MPFLLISIGAGLFVLHTAKPDYVMTSYVQFIPARIGPTDLKNPTSASLRNPWNQLGLDTLGQATIYATQDKDFAESLKASNHTTNFTLSITYPNPIVAVEVVGTSPADATETTKLVINKMGESARLLQTDAGAASGDLITMVRLDRGLNVSPSHSKLKRAIMGVAAAGLVMTAGGTIGLDALLRRRARKRKEGEQVDSPPRQNVETATVNGNEVPASAKVPVPPGEPALRPLNGAPPEKPTEYPASRASAAPPDAVDRTAVVVKRAAPVVHPPSPAPSPRRPAATYKSTYAQPDGDGESHAFPSVRNGDSAVAPSDVQVVLQPKRLDGENGRKHQ